MKRLIIALLALQLIGCEQTRSDHPIWKYYPSPDLLEDGYVSKYYYHYYPDNSDRDAASKIIYAKYQLLGEGQLLQENYNAAFDLEQRRLFEIKGDSMILLEEKNISSYDVADTTETEFVNRLSSVWTTSTEQLDVLTAKYNSGDEEYLYSIEQLAVSDSVVDELPAKVFDTGWKYIQVSTDSAVSNGTSKALFVQGLGFYASTLSGPGATEMVELVEQMSVEEFDKRAGHGENRVAWIDPDQSMSDDTDFKICGHERNIADYYNSTPDGRYVHSKRALMDTVKANLDESKLFNQNGRLVFRFVVNCEGRPGRFIARGYDLDYQPMDFKEETIDHLFSILQKLKEWNPVVVREEPADAYFYITFNIIDGEITDILP